MATIKKTINRQALDQMIESGMSKSEIAEELGLLMGQLNILGKQLGINWRSRKRKNVIFEIVDNDPNQPEGEEFVTETTIA